MNITKGKTKYSKNEKIVRIICFFGIALSVIVGILLFFIHNYIGGILTLVACAVSLILVNSIAVSKFKALISKQEKKKIILALFYIFIILLSMVTAFIFATDIYIPYEEAINIAIEYAKNDVKETVAGATIVEIDAFEAFDSGDSYYIALEIHYTLAETGGTVSSHFPVSYLKVNKITGRVEAITFAIYETAKTYV